MPIGPDHCRGQPLQSPPQARQEDGRRDDAAHAVLRHPPPANGPSPLTQPSRGDLDACTRIEKIDQGAGGDGGGARHHRIACIRTPGRGRHPAHRRGVRVRSGDVHSAKRPRRRGGPCGERRRVRRRQAGGARRGALSERHQRGERGHDGAARPGALPRRSHRVLRHRGRGRSGPERRRRRHRGPLGPVSRAAPRPRGRRRLVEAAVLRVPVRQLRNDVSPIGHRAAIRPRLARDPLLVPGGQKRCSTAPVVPPPASRSNAARPRTGASCRRRAS